MNDEPLISIVSPVYKAEKIVPELIRRIVLSVEAITNNYEMVLVCDGSPDDSWNAIKYECDKNKKIIGVNLSRNFGQHYALSAGLNMAKGNWVVVMDCDLQDRPEEIAGMLKYAQDNGYDAVVAKRTARKDGFVKRMSSVCYNRVYQWLSGMSADNSIANFGIYNRKVVSAFCEMKDVSRSFQSLLAYLGFNIGVVEVEHSQRYEGKSSYSWRKLFALSSDIILANSNKPLKLTIRLGLIITILAVLMILYNLIAYLTSDVLPGFSATIISIWFVGGLNVFVLGVFGLYLDKIFNQVKNRPLYIISEVINGK